MSENPRRPWHSPGVTGDFCDAYAASALIFKRQELLHSCTHRLVTNNELQEPQNSPQATLLNSLDAEQHNFTRALKGTSLSCIACGWL